MATDKYSKRPGRARAAGSRLLTDAHVTIKPRFCVALIALALADRPVPRSPNPCPAARANPNASRTTLDPIPEGGWEGLANVLKAVQPGVDTRLTPTASQVTDHIERLLNRGDNATALDMIEKRQAETKGQRGTDVQLMFQHARPGRPAPHGGGHRRLHRDDHQLPRIAGTLEQPCRSICGSR